MRGMRRWGALGVVLALVAGVVAASVASAGAVAAPIAAGGIRAQQPSVSGTRVVWADYRSGQWDIWLYDAAVKRARKVTTGAGDKVQPSISGDTIVYVAYGATTKGDIYAYDIPSGTTKALSTASGDQLNPVVGGAWVAWEDYSSTYNNCKIFAYNLTSGVTMPVAGSSSYQYRRPRIGGGVLVYERSLEKDIIGYVRGQSDLMYADLGATAATGPITSAALVETPADERVASTDGTWVAWMQYAGGTGYDIKAKNIQTGQVVSVTSAPGEQALPIVGNGVVYWVDASNGVRLSTMNLETGATSAFPYRTRTDISGLTASGNALAWLQPEGGRWTVKVLLGAPVPGVQLTSLLPKTTALWSPLSFATLSTGGDAVSPKVTSSSVAAGETGVDGSEPLTVSFSEQMAPASVNERSVQLLDSATGATVPADVSYSTLSKTATVKPGQRLSGSYLLQVSPSVTDQAGNAAADVFAVSFATQGAELIAAAAPDTVGQVSARIVNESGNVQLTWTAGADPDGDLVGYQVKRFTAATLDPTTFSAAATLTPIAGPMTIAGTMATFAAASDELSRTSTYYYAVVGIDSAGNYSPVWYNISPNPHATEVNGMNTNSCLRCHSVHGAASGGLLGARSAAGCYRCHGSTDQASTVGTNSVNNIQGEFFDYPVASMTDTSTAPSRHGNAYIRANADNMQCDMCHAPHKRSYNDSEPISYRKLLRRNQLATDSSSTVLYSADSAAFGKELCYNCHGSGGDEASPGSAPYTNMYYYGGTSAFANTAGDHNQTAWDTVGTAGPAHGTQHVNDVARPLALGGSLPNNACQVCHAEHGSESASLLAYRREATTTALAEGQLCFKCHSATAAAPDNAVNKNAWNSRDVSAEFKKTGSTHPNSTTGSMQVPQESAGTPALIDSATDFTNLTSSRSNIDLASVAGSAVLTKATIDPPSAPYLFVDPAGTRVDSLLPGSSTFNQDFAPTDMTANGAGASAAEKNGYLFAIRGGAVNNFYTYTPPAGAGTGTWGAATNLWQTATTGSDLVEDTTDGYLWALVGGYTPVNGTNAATNIRRTTNFAGTTVAWYDDGSGTGEDGPYFCTTANTPLRLGAGSALAWVPANGTRTERLYAINRDGINTRNGALYYFNNPDAATGGTAWTSTTHVIGTTGTTSDAGTRMVYFRIGTTDYLFALRGAANVEYLIQLANTTAAAGTVLDNGSTNPWNGNVGEGCDIWWNGDTTQAGFRLYATRGGNNANSPLKVATWNGTALVWSNGPNLLANTTTGGWLAMVDADPAMYTSATDYNSAGTFLIDNATPAAGDTVWSRLSWVDQLPANTNVTVTVKTSAGVDIPGYTNVSGETVDLSALSTATYPQLDFLVTLSTTNVLSTPQLDDMELYSARMVAQATGTTTCYNCHNTHFVSEGAAATAWQMGRVSDPQDTNGAYAGTSTNFCLRCHGGTGYNASTGAVNIAATTNSINTLVPYTIGMRPTTSWPFFNGWNKSLANFEFLNSGHNSATAANGKALCENCHDPHGSDNKSLTAWTRPAGVTWTGTAPAASVRDNSVAGAGEENLCYKCHGDGASGRGKAAGAANVYTPTASTYGHPVATSDRHETDEDADRLLSDRHAECGDCHDPHAARAGVHTTGTATAGQALRGATGVVPTYGTATMMAAPTSWTTRRLTSTGTDYEAYVCLKCHSSYLPNWATAAPNSPSGGFRQTDLAAEFNPNNASGHNVLGDVFTKNVTNGAYTWTAPTTANLNLAAGWDITSSMTCSDCHASNGTAARGPHGSAVPYMLKNGSTTAGAEWYEVVISNWSSAQNMCNRCHTAQPHSWATRSDHDRQCQHCHVAIPHGWKRPRLLHNSTDSAPYRLTGDGAGWAGVTLKSYAVGPTNESDCGDSCSSSRHPTTGTKW